ncbi:tripartite tricarboxylate transporter TctB family protein [Arthrobacter sp. MDT1-65]
MSPSDADRRATGGSHPVHPEHLDTVHRSELVDDLTPEDLAAQWAEEKPPAAGPGANIASAVVVTALGIVGTVGSLRLGLGSPADPEPGLWPFLISVLLVVLGLALALFGRNLLDAEKFSRSSLQVAAGLASLVVFTLLIGRIGFEIPALLLNVVWLRFLGRETWRMTIVLSVAITVAFYLLFVLALNVPIPHLF